MDFCLAIAAAVVGCGRAPDTEGNVRRALDQANMQVVQVDVDDDSNIVHLKGPWTRWAIARVRKKWRRRRSVPSGRVLNELTVKGLNDETADDFDDDIDET